MESAPDDDFEITYDGCYSDYAITEDSVLLKAEIDLKSDQTEQAIRGELKAVFEKRYPDIGLYDFEFVKRERNVLITPIVKDNHSWDIHSGKARDKCQEETVSATRSNVDLCNTSTGTILEPVDETSESSAQPSCSINDGDHDDLLRASGAINSTLDQRKSGKPINNVP